MFSSKYNIILASQSPRREYLLKELGLKFTIKTNNVNETYPQHLQKEEIPIYLSGLKAKSFDNTLTNNDLVITADTIVWANNKELGKPQGKTEAIKMLQALSGNKHTVYTGVCLKTISNKHSFWASTDVYFCKLTDTEIEYYLNKYKPYDKAGAYGIQEWIGYVAIEKIVGSYFNVMGLPIQKLYSELKKYDYIV